MRHMATVGASGGAVAGAGHPQVSHLVGPLAMELLGSGFRFSLRGKDRLGACLAAWIRGCYRCRSRAKTGTEGCSKGQQRSRATHGRNRNGALGQS